MGGLKSDPYRLLGLEPWATENEIKRAYRALALRSHPDRDPSPEAAERFRTVHAAYRVLMDPVARAWCDELLQAGTRNGAGDRPQRSPRSNVPAPSPPTRAQRRLFRGLHATGFVFGWALVIGVPLGMAFSEWPPSTLVMVIPGLAVIPDSYMGIRAR